MKQFAASILHRKWPLAALGLIVVLIVSLVTMWPAHAAIAYRSATTANNGSGSTSITVNTPSGVQTDDVLLVFISTRGGNGVTITKPSTDWSVIDTANRSSTIKDATYWYVVPSSPPSSFTFTLSASQPASAVAVAYSGVDQTQAVDVFDNQGAAASTTMSAPTVTTNYTNDMIVAFYGSARTTTFTAGSGMTLRGQDSSTGGTSATTSGGQDALQSTAGASGAKTMTQAASAQYIGHTIALKPAPVVSLASYRFFTNIDGTGGSWWNGSWTNRRKVTFDNSASTENLTNFPVLVQLTSANIDYAKTQSSGQDIRFVDPDGTTLSYEIEKWDSSGTSDVWVKVPQIDAGSTTDYIYMYYGNTSASDAQNASSVWSNGYRGVWHSSESSGTSISDSTGNGNTGTLKNGAAITTSGKIGNANTYDGTNDSMDAGSGSTLDNLYSQGGGGMTVSAWVNSVDSGQWSEVASKAQNGDPANGWLIDVDDHSTKGITAEITGTGGTGDLWNGSTSTSYGVWQYYTVTYAGGLSGTAFGLYINGTAADNGSAGSITSPSSDASYNLTSGCDMPATNPNECLQGKIDELRVSNVVRSPSWIRAEYISTNNAMNTFGSEETYTPSPTMSPLAAQDTPITIAAGTPFRMRLNLGVTDYPLPLTQTFKILYAARGGDNVCDASGTGESYAGVNSVTSDIRYYDNPTPADGDPYQSMGTDPTRSGITAVGQSYNEQNPFKVFAAVPAGQDALWDFALTTPSSLTVGTHYCIHAFDTNLQALTGGYDVTPEIIIGNPTYTQDNYRFLANADSATPGAALAAQNTAPTVATSTPFRLRMLLAQTTGVTAASTNFKLQTAQKSGTCSASTFSDIGSTGLILYDNPTPANGASISSTANDPTPTSGTATLESYVESSPLSAGTQIPYGGNGLWDIALQGDASAAGKTYCLRLVDASGTALATYSQYPEVSFVAGGPTLDQQLRGGQSVVGGSKGPFSW